MSGAPYPRLPDAGENAIGKFTIGVSPIGTISFFDVWDTIISQYANSPILTQLITNFAENIDPTADFDSFWDLIWDVDTAVGYGLDVWGRIVGVTRVLSIVTGDYLGFEGPTGRSGEPFDVEPFYNGSASTTSFAMTDNAFRTLIFAKALANISDGSIRSINQILLNLFPGRGNCYVIDGLNMTMQYHFTFSLSPVEQAIVGQSGVLPKPTGVLASTFFP